MLEIWKYGGSIISPYFIRSRLISAADNGLSYGQPTEYRNLFHGTFWSLSITFLEQLSGQKRTFVAQTFRLCLCFRRSNAPNALGRQLVLSSSSKFARKCVQTDIPLPRIRITVSKFDIDRIRFYV